MKEIYVVPYDKVRDEFRKEFSRNAQEDRDSAISALITINEILASHKYDPMSVVLSVLLGLRESTGIENKSPKELFSDLKTIFTALDIVMEIHEDFVEVLSSGNTELLQDTLMRKFEEYSRD